MWVTSPCSWKWSMPSHSCLERLVSCATALTSCMPTGVTIVTSIVRPWKKEALSTAWGGGVSIKASAWESTAGLWSEPLPGSIVIVACVCAMSAVVRSIKPFSLSRLRIDMFQVRPKVLLGTLRVFPPLAHLAPLAPRSPAPVAQAEAGREPAGARRPARSAGEHTRRVRRVKRVGRRAADG